MLSSLEKMRGDKKGWYKVSDLVKGVEIAMPSKTGEMLWDEIVSITPVGREQVYDIEVEGTHNFVGNGIFAHNTYVLKANTMLAVEGTVNAGSFTVPIGSVADATSTSALGREIPPEVLTADGTGVDLYKLATYNLAKTQTLGTRMDASDVRLTSLETRVEKLESGAIGAGSTTANVGTGLASAFEGFGALIQKGIAQFNTLVFRQLVASKDADGTSSAGSVVLLTGNTVAQVTNSLVAPSTKVFVTFNSQITGSWWVSDKTAGSFRVVLSAAQTADVSFDYFLVQTEGQIATSTPNGIQGSAVGGSLTSNASGSQTSSTAGITILGDNPMHVSVDSVFTDPGISVAGGAPYTTFVNGIEQVVSSTTISTATPTTYLITYKATDASGAVHTAMRSVIVGNPDGTVSISGSTNIQGSTLNTNTQGQTLNATTTPADTVPPVVTLNGSAAIALTIGDTYTDAGATALDAVDGDLTAKIVKTGTVDTTTAGSYSLTYSATDKAGNTASVGRIVTVSAPI